VRGLPNYIWRTVPLIRAAFIHSSGVIINRILSPRILRPLTNAISVTGYATAFCFLPIHFITHRLTPWTLCHRDPSRPLALRSSTTSTSRQRSASGLAGASYYIPFLSSMLLCTLLMRSGSSGPHGSQVGGYRGVGQDVQRCHTCADGARSPRL
jgi:hypothetical protein